MTRDKPIDLDGATAQKRFHECDREFLGLLYRETYDAVDRAVGRVLRGADRETVVHDVYLRLLTKPELRRSFTGGSMRSWLMTIAHNLAGGFLRRQRPPARLAGPAGALLDPPAGRVGEQGAPEL